jgi:TP901 family phage tail tape measure protein
VNRFSVETVFKAKDQMSAAIGRMGSKVDGLAKSADRSLTKLSGNLSKISGSFQAVGAAVTAAAIGGGIAFIDITKTGMVLEQTMSNVAAVSGASAQQVDALTAKAKLLGSTTKFTASEVAGAMEIMSKAGMSVDQTLTGVGAILSAAAADGATIEETASSIMSSMKGLGLGPEKMQTFADMAAKAGDATSASIGSIAESMAVFGPVAKQLSIPLESSIAQLALLQDAGIDASSAGTTLAATYSKLAAPTKRTRDELKALGLTVVDAMGNMKPPDQLLNELFAATSQIEGNAGKMAAVTNLVGLESQKALLNIASAAGDGRLGKLTKDLRDSSGYADEIAKKKLDNLAGDLTLLGSAANGVKLELFDMAKGPLRDLVKGTTEWINANKGLMAAKVEEWVVKVKDNLPEIVTWLKRIGTAVAVFYALKTAVTVAQVAIAAYGIAAQAVTGVIWLYNAATTATTVSQVTATAATVASRVATVASTLAQGALSAATWVYNAAITAGTFASTGFTVSQIASKVAQVASTVATWAITAAQTAYNFAVGAGALGLGAITAAFAASVPAAGAAAVATGTATLALGPFLIAVGAAAAAVAALTLAWNQYQSLDKSLGDVGVGGTVERMWDKGSLDFFGAYDEVANEKAAERARNRPQMVSPQARTAAAISETNTNATTTNKSEVTIKAPAGAARVTKPSKGPGTTLKLQPSGGM